MNLQHKYLVNFENDQQLLQINNGVFVFDENTLDLTFVDLKDNMDLQEIRFEVPQPNLLYLDASRTGLKKIVFSHACKNLQSIYLHRNQLTSFEIKVELSKLELLDLILILRKMRIW